MTDGNAEGTPARHIDLALIAVACLILVGAHVFGAGWTRSPSPVLVERDAAARSGPPNTRSAGQRPEIPDAVSKAQSLLPGMRDAESVKGDLRNVVIVQEAYFSQHSTYATSLEQLLDAGLALRSGATVRILHASQNGWAAEAVRDGSDTDSCIVHIGQQAGDASPATRRDGRTADQGIPACDGDR